MKCIECGGRLTSDGVDFDIMINYFHCQECGYKSGVACRPRFEED